LAEKISWSTLQPITAVKIGQTISAGSPLTRLQKTNCVWVFNLVPAGKSSKNVNNHLERCTDVSKLTSLSCIKCLLRRTASSASSLRWKSNLKILGQKWRKVLMF